MNSFLVFILTLMIFCRAVHADDQRAIFFSSKAVRLCGHSISWQSVMAGLSPKEADCLDSVSPLDFSDSEIIKSAQIIELTQERIVDLLKKSRSLCLSEVELRIPSRITFTREKFLTPETTFPWLEQQFKSQFEDKIHEIVRLQIPKLECEKNNSVKWGSFRVDGINQFRMLITADDKNFNVNGEFRLFQELPVLSRPLMANQRIDSKDLVLAKKDVTLNQGFVPKVEEIIGRTLTFPIAAGEPVQYRQLKKESLVEKGQVVQVHYKSDSFLLSATGVAEQNGSIGDNIKIKNMETQKTFSGVISGKGLVEVQ